MKVKYVAVFFFFIVGICLNMPLWAGGKKSNDDYKAVPPESFSIYDYAVDISSFEKNELKSDSVITLTVEESVRYALDNSISMKIASLDLEIKERKKNTAWNVFIPNVSVNGTLARANEVSNLLASIPGIPPSMIPAITESSHWTPMASIAASLNLNFALVDGIKATKSNYESGLISWEQSKKQTERDIRKMFYSILLMEQNLKLQKDMLATAQQRVDQARINFRNGLVPELTVLQAQVAYENRKPAIMELEQLVTQQHNLFAFLLGLPYGTKISLTGTIEPDFLALQADNLIAKYIGNRFDIITLSKNIEILEIQRSALIHQTYTPSIALSYSYAPRVKAIDKNWFDKDNISDGGNFSLSLVFNLTALLPFSSQAQNIKDVEANIVKLRLSLASTIQNTEMEINSLVQKLEKSQSSILASQLNINLAQKAYDLTVVAFRNGTKELLDVRDAESQLNQAQLVLLQEKHNYVSGLLDLEYILNIELGK